MRMLSWTLTTGGRASNRVHLSFWRRRLVQTASEAREHPDRGDPIAVAHTLERLCNGGLHRAELHSVRTLPSCGEAKHGTPTITRMSDAEHHLLLDQPLQDTGQCARV
jgi:hypothetical protein